MDLSTRFSVFTNCSGFKSRWIERLLFTKLFRIWISVNWALAPHKYVPGLNPGGPEHSLPIPCLNPSELSTHSPKICSGFESRWTWAFVSHYWAPGLNPGVPKHSLSTNVPRVWISADRRTGFPLLCPWLESWCTSNLCTRFHAVDLITHFSQMCFAFESILIGYFFTNVPVIFFKVNFAQHEYFSCNVVFK